MRLAAPPDGAAIAGIYAPFVTGTAVSFEVEPPTADEMAARVAATLPTWPWLVADVDGAARGFAYATQHRARPAYRWSVDVSVYVDASAQRQGLGRRLYGVLFDLLAEQGFRQAFAGITLPNDASVGLHGALGFDLVGTYRDVGHKLDRWHDVSWFQKPLGRASTGGAPGTIRSLDEVDLAAIDGLTG